MAEDTFDGGLLRWILPRVIKAAFWGFIMGGEAMLLYLSPGIREQVETFIPVGGVFFSGFMAVFIFFEVAMQLSSGTVLRYAFGMARALATMIALLYASHEGVVSQVIPLGPGEIRVTIEFRTILAMLLTLSLLAVFKNIMYAVDFLSQKSEEPIILKEHP